MTVEHAITTAFGNAKVRLLDGNTLFFDAHSNCGTYETVGLTINGVRYGVNSHMWKWSDGQWHIGREDKPEERYQCFYITRAAILSAKNVPVKTAEKVKAEIVLAVNTWISHHEDDLLDAEIASLAAKLEKAEKELADHKMETATLADKVTELNTKLTIAKSMKYLRNSNSP